LELGEGMIPAEKTGIGGPWFIPMKACEHTWIMLFHELKKIQECQFLLLGS